MIHRNIVLIALIASIAGAVSMASASVQDQAKKQAKESSSAITYTCPMHPKVISSTAGKCPDCGMDLVKKEADSKKEKRTKTKKMKAKGPSDMGEDCSCCKAGEGSSKKESTHH